MTRRRPAPPSLADVKLSASTSLRESEVAFLAALLPVLLRGGDARPLVQRHPLEVAGILRKLPAMRRQIVRNRVRREEMSRCPR